MFLKSLSIHEKQDLVLRASQFFGDWQITHLDADPLAQTGLVGEAEQKESHIIYLLKRKRKIQRARITRPELDPTHSGFSCHVAWCGYLHRFSPRNKMEIRHGQVPALGMTVTIACLLLQGPLKDSISQGCLRCLQAAEGPCSFVQNHKLAVSLC